MLNIEALKRAVDAARAAGAATVVVPVVDLEVLIAAVARGHELTAGMARPHRSEVATLVEEVFGTGDPSADGAGCGARKRTSSHGVQGGLDVDDLLNGVDL